MNEPRQVLTLELVAAVGASQTAGDVIGLWQTVAPAGRSRSVLLDALAFDVGAESATPRAEPAASGTGGPDTAPTMWRVSLPADPECAAASLVSAEATLAAMQESLETVVDRLRRFATREGLDASFGVGDTAWRARAEPEARLETMFEAPRGGLDVAFDLQSQPEARWRQVIPEFLAHLERFQRAVTHYAWVETTAGSQRVGWTIVDWTGSMTTIWPLGVTAEQTALHQRALNLALRSRATLMRALGLAIRGALILSRAVASPLGLILTVPAAWTFIQDVLTETRRAAAGEAITP
jgi:hypothetical protein